MSNTLQLKALIKKNLILKKRNWCSSLCELLFPIILMMLIVWIRGLIKVEEEKFDFTDKDYLEKESAGFPSSNNFNLTNSSNFISDWNKMTFRNPL